MMRMLLILITLSVLGCKVEIPIARPHPQAPAILHPIERVAYSNDWRFETQRAAGPGEWVFVVLRLPPDSCVPITPSNADIRLLQMMPMEIDTSSGEGGRTGTFYEILPPRNEVTCSASRYVLAEWRVSKSETVTFIVGQTMLSVGVKMLPFGGQRKPFFVGMGNANLIKGHCPTAYCKKEGLLGRLYANLLVEHGLQPMQNWVRVPPIRNGVLNLDADSESGTSFRQLVQAYAISGFIGFPRARRYDDRVDYLQALEATVQAEGLVGRAWIYAVDEPQNQKALLKELALYRIFAPSLKIMVTTDRHPDLDPFIDFYAPVYNRLLADNAPDFEDYQGKALWSYLSCMGSCGPNRAEKPDVEKIPGPDTGLPDLLIDRPASRLFRFFREGAENGLNAALYYEAVEGYRLIPKGVDVTLDPWNFGGNGDGLLVFPGTTGRYGLAQDAAIASFRLKLLRHARQTYW